MANIAAAVLYVLRDEDSRLRGTVTTDQGGKTRFGIAQKFHPELDPSFYTCPAPEALAQAQLIYAKDYAAPLLLSLITSQPTANKLLDVGINCGVGISARMAQTAVTTLGKPVTVDEHIGPASIAAINAVDSSKLMAQLITLSKIYYRNVAVIERASPDELASWLTRAAKPGI
jgi:lysozyme family protein